MIVFVSIQAHAYTASFIIRSQVDCTLTISCLYYSEIYRDNRWQKIGTTDCFNQELSQGFVDFAYEGQGQNFRFLINGCGVEKEIDLYLIAGKTIEATINSEFFNNIPYCFSTPLRGVEDLQSLDHTLWFDPEDKSHSCVIGFDNGMIDRSYGDGFDLGKEYYPTDKGYFFMDISTIGFWLQTGKYSCNDGCTMQGPNFMLAFLLPIPFFFQEKWVLIDDNWSYQ